MCLYLKQYFMILLVLFNLFLTALIFCMEHLEKWHYLNLENYLRHNKESSKMLKSRVYQKKLELKISETQKG